MPDDLDEVIAALEQRWAEETGAHERDISYALRRLVDTGAVRLSVATAGGDLPDDLLLAFATSRDMPLLIEAGGTLGTAVVAKSSALGKTDPEAFLIGLAADMCAGPRRLYSPPPHHPPPKPKKRNPHRAAQKAAKAARKAGRRARS